MDNDLRKIIRMDDFKPEEKEGVIPWFCHYDGINYTGIEENGVLTQRYFNGDIYKRIYEKDSNKQIIKVTFSFYDKESNITYSSEREIDKDIIYKKTVSEETIDVSKEEYDEFTKEFIKKNNITFFDIFENLCI